MAASSKISKLSNIQYDKVMLFEGNFAENSQGRISFDFFDKMSFKSKLAESFVSAQKTNVGQLLRRGKYKLNNSVFITPKNDIFILYNTSNDAVIAKGSRKKVKLALNVVTREFVAYKAIRELHDPNERNAIIDEYELGLTLTGGSFCKPIEGTLRIEHDRIVYLEEYMPCGDLTRLHDQSIEEKGVLPLALQMASTLADLHDQGYLSRDIKPANYFIERNKEGILKIRLGDFGEAVPIDSISLKKQLPMWTYGFVSPEYKRAAATELRDERLQAVAEETTVKSDSWALGISMLAIFQERLSEFIDANPTLKEFLKSKDQDAFVEGLMNDSPWIKNPENENSLEYVIYKLLIVDPEERWSPRQAADHLRVMTLEPFTETSSLIAMDSPSSLEEAKLVDVMSVERKEADSFPLDFSLSDLRKAVEELFDPLG